MKIFKLFGMALLATILCVNFIACSSDDDPERPKEERQEKKLIEFKQTKDAQAKIVFFYQNNLLNRAICNNVYETLNCEYTWSESKINCVAEQYESCYNLNKGQINVAEIINKKRNIHKYIKYNYSDQQLKSMSSYKDEYKNTTSFVWEHNKLVKYDEKGYEDIEIEYGEKVCNGYFPSLVWFFHYCDFLEVSDAIYLAHPELIGMKSKFLPTKVSVTEGKGKYITIFEYNFDQDNYVTSCKIKEYEIDSSIPNHEDNNLWENTYYFTWE